MGYSVSLGTMGGTHATACGAAGTPVSFAGADRPVADGGHLDTARGSQPDRARDVGQLCRLAAGRVAAGGTGCGQHRCGLRRIHRGTVGRATAGLGQCGAGRRQLCRRHAGRGRLFAGGGQGRMADCAGGRRVGHRIAGATHAARAGATARADPGSGSSPGTVACVAPPAGAHGVAAADAVQRRRAVDAGHVRPVHAGSRHDAGAGGLAVRLAAYRRGPDRGRAGGGCWCVLLPAGRRCGSPSGSRPAYCWP